MAGRNEWRVVSTTVTELEQQLNGVENDGWEVTYLFPPEDSNSQFFTLVVKRPRQGAAPPAGAGSRAMGFGDEK
jgi:hypothetical protein